MIAASYLSLIARHDGCCLWGMTERTAHGPAPRNRRHRLPPSEPIRASVVAPRGERRKRTSPRPPSRRESAKLTLDLSDDGMAKLADAIVSRLREMLAPAALPDERYLTRAEATQLGVERRALIRAERAGKLRAFKPGRRVMYRRGDVVALVERCGTDPAPPRESPRGMDPLDPFERALTSAERRSGTGP